MLSIVHITEKILGSTNKLRILTPGDMHPPETFVYLNNLNRNYAFQGLVLFVMAPV